MLAPMSAGLDLVTTLFINAFIHLLMALLLGLFWRSARRGGEVGFGWWVLNEALLFSAALALMALPVLPEGWMLGFNNAAYFAFTPLLELGLRRWLARPLRPAMDLRWAVAAVALVGWTGLWLGGQDYATRAVWFAGVSVLQCLLLGVWVAGLLREAPDGARQGLALIALAAALGALMNAWRLQQTWPYVHTGQPVPTYPLSTLMAVDIAIAVLRVAAMLLLLHGRVEARLRQATVALERRANIDGLTQVCSRAHFESASSVLLTQARASRVPVCLLVVDMDGFKAINDELGHPEGDALLVRFAARLRASLRDGDLAGRLGGDEFAVLLFDSPLADAQRIAERLRAGVAGELAAADGRRITLSAGLALARPGEDFEALYRRADRALYAAKAAGRNRVVAEA